MMWIIGLLAKCSFQTIFSLEGSKDYRIQTTDNKENLKSLIKLAFGSSEAMVSTPKSSNADALAPSP